MMFKVLALLSIPAYSTPYQRKFFAPDQVRYNTDFLKSNRKPRQLQGVPDQYKPIRVHYDVTGLENNLVNHLSLLRYFKDDVLPATSRWLSNAVKVKPVIGNLQMPQHCDIVSVAEGLCMRISPDWQECGPHVTVPRNHFADQSVCDQFGSCETNVGGDGIPDADVVIYVSAVHGDSCADGSSAAYSSFCFQDGLDRPIGGFVNICVGSFAWNRRNWRDDMATILHETIHVLGFNMDLFAFFRESDGVTPRTERDRFGSPPISTEGRLMPSKNTIVSMRETAQYTLQWGVVTPLVKQYAEKYFGCNQIEAVPLEDEGGEGSFGSHWEARVLSEDLMAARIYQGSMVSKITLALLEDSGWYKTDSSASGYLNFGRGKGCEFVNGDCVKDGVSQFPDDFCDQTSDVAACSRGLASGGFGCSPGRLAVATCSICRHDRPLPDRMQYFSDPRLGGVNDFMNFCPTWEPFHMSRGEFSGCDESFYSNSPLQTFGSDARCFLSGETREGQCYKVRCGAKKRNETATYEISLGGNWYTCPPGGRLSNPAFVQCPKYDDICNSISDRCEHGYVVDGRCSCVPGYLNGDCSVQDLKTTRDSYPLGMRYPGELVLKAGTSVSKTKNLQAWPFQPEVEFMPDSESKPKYAAVSVRFSCRISYRKIILKWEK